MTPPSTPLSAMPRPPASEVPPITTAAIAGGTAPCVMNAANEVAVEAFLERRIRFDQIHALNLQVLSAVAHRCFRSMDLLAITFEQLPSP